MPTIFRDVVTVGDISFNDPLAPWLPAGVVSAGMDVLLGWDSTPELDAVFTEIGGVDGEIPADFFSAKGRQLMIGGWGHAIDRATAHQMTDVLVAQAFPRNQELRLARYEPVPKFMDVRRNGSFDVEWTGPDAFRWSVEARAADPFKYALFPQVESIGVAGQSIGGRSYPRTYPLIYTTTVAGQANVAVMVNVGTASSSRMIATITGPLSAGGWRISNETSNGILQFDIGLAASDVLEINFHDETVMLNNAPVTVTVAGDFFRLEPGPNVLKLFGDYDPAVLFTVTAYSAWE